MIFSDNLLTISENAKMTKKMKMSGAKMQHFENVQMTNCWSDMPFKLVLGHFENAKKALFLKKSHGASGRRRKAVFRAGRANHLEFVFIDTELNKDS